MTRPSPELFGLTDATSKAGPAAVVCGACARNRASLTATRAAGMTTTAIAAVMERRRMLIGRVMVVPFASILVRHERLDAIDDDDVDRTSLRIQLEAEL